MNFSLSLSLLALSIQLFYKKSPLSNFSEKNFFWRLSEKEENKKGEKQKEQKKNETKPLEKEKEEREEEKKEERKRIIRSTLQRQAEGKNFQTFL